MEWEDSGGVMKAMVTRLRHEKRLRLDGARLQWFLEQMDEDAAEEALCAALEGLARDLSRVTVLARAGDRASLDVAFRALVPAADRVGMCTLARVARDALHCISIDDSVAQAAVLARLARVGERSVAEVWDLRDMSV
ncbi:hypothetical protein [Sediminimonas sp.]|uniref:hypothetical protein n=1 Tax=Sediminimonas sp. TaxID=2823379 RepID=UPI0025E951AB|nr:hypothetical protein [Sediminimonas sp.]